jgi:hypothetical protein
MSEKIYGWSLKLYPARFREEYGTSAMQLFRESFRTERGIFRRFPFCLDGSRSGRLRPTRAPAAESRRTRVGGIPDLRGRRPRRSAAAPAVCVSIFVLLGLTAGWPGNSEHVLLFAAYILLAGAATNRFRSIGSVGEYWRSYKLIPEADRQSDTVTIPPVGQMRNGVATGLVGRVDS